VYLDYKKTNSPALTEKDSGYVDFDRKTKKGYITLDQVADLIRGKGIEVVIKELSSIRRLRGELNFVGYAINHNNGGPKIPRGLVIVVNEDNMMIRSTGDTVEAKDIIKDLARLLGNRYSLKFTEDGKYSVNINFSNPNVR